MKQIIAFQLRAYAQEWIMKDNQIDIERWQAFVEDMQLVKDQLSSAGDDINLQGWDGNRIRVTSSNELYGDLGGMANGTILSVDENVSFIPEFMLLQELLDQYQCKYTDINHCFVPLTTIALSEDGLRDEFMQEIYDMICESDHPIMDASDVMVFLLNQTVKVLNGEAALDEAAEELSDRLALYLSE